MATLALESPTFQPAMRIVTAITQANPASVTTSFDHDYKNGTVVRLIVPEGFGMDQMNERYEVVTITGTDTFTIAIDSSKFDAFSVPGSNKQYAQSLAIGEINSTLEARSENVL